MLDPRAEQSARTTENLVVLQRQLREAWAPRRHVGQLEKPMQEVMRIIEMARQVPRQCYHGGDGSGKETLQVTIHKHLAEERRPVWAIKFVQRDSRKPLMESEIIRGHTPSVARSRAPRNADRCSEMAGRGQLLSRNELGETGRDNEAGRKLWHERAGRRKRRRLGSKRNRPVDR